MTDVHLEELPHVAHALMQGHDPSGYFFWIADKVGACAVCVPVKLRPGHRGETTRLRNLGPGLEHVTGPQSFAAAALPPMKPNVSRASVSLLDHLVGTGEQLRVSRQSQIA